MNNAEPVKHEPLTPLSRLFEKNLKIPPYQRTYCWESEHVSDLLKDTFNRTSKYLMGTVILHKQNDKSNNEFVDIVDGQQRLVTLTILLNQLKYPADSLRLLNKGEFSKSSWWYIIEAQKNIANFISGKEVKELERYQKLLANDLLFSVLTIEGGNALDLAYTFFDSVNSKGKPLTDFDLLKAHHLMFIPAREEELAKNHNDVWQQRDERHKEVFANTLRRLRMWSRGLDRDSRAERPDYYEFCDRVEPEKAANHEYMFNRYMQPAAFRSWRREGGRVILSMDYPVLDAEELIPTEVTQTIVGGDPFFIYAKRYHRLYETLYLSDNNKKDKSSTACVFIRNLAENIQNEKLKSAFRAVIMLYFDKFGEDRLIEAAVCVERIISSWRWKAYSVRIEGTLTHVNNSRLVPITLEAVTARQVVEQLISVAEKNLTSLPKLEKPGPTVTSYFVTLASFYEINFNKIADERVKSLTSGYFQKGSDHE